VIPKIYWKHISELPEEHATALGVAVTRVSKVLTEGLAIGDYVPIGEMMSVRKG
jgi:hypothetical protein